VAAVVVTAAVAVRFRPAMAWRYLAAILGAGAVLGVAAAFVPIPLGGALGDLVRTVVWTSAALAGTAFALWHAPAGYGVRARIVRLMRPADAA
jgi:hypothetical protein